MPKNKSWFLRVLVIDKAIRNKSYPNKPKLLSEISKKLYGPIGERTFDDDIRDMREILKAPIGYSKKLRGYYYIDPDYSLIKALHKIQLEL